MITPHRLHRVSFWMRYLCILFTALVGAGSAAGAQVAPTLAPRVYFPLAAFHTCHAPAPGYYCLLDLGTAGQYSEARGLNQSAQVAGNIFVPAGTAHGVIPHAAWATSGRLNELAF